MQKSRRRRLWKMLAGTFASITALAVAVRIAIALSVLPAASAYSFGSSAIGMRNGALQLVTANSPLSGDGNTWLVGTGRLLLAYPEKLLPSRTTAAMSFGGGGTPTVTLSVQAYYVPLPFIALICLALATFFFWTGRPRPLAGHCSKCDYDLRGNTSGRCPECGTETAELRAILRTWIRRLLGMRRPREMVRAAH